MARLQVDAQGRVLASSLGGWPMAGAEPPSLLSLLSSDSHPNDWPALLHPTNPGGPVDAYLANTSDKAALGEHICALVLPPGAASAGTAREVLVRFAERDDESSHISALQREVLEAVAQGRQLEQVMRLLCERVDAIAPEVSCSVLAIDEQRCLRPIAAPGLPAGFGQAIDGLPIGPKVGSCGTAAWRGEPVEVTDIAHDPLWEDFAELAGQFGLAACWSTPILVHGRVVATFALYYRTPRAAAWFHRRMVEACSRLCQLAFQHDLNQREIERLAFVDGITGLANRRRLTEIASALLPLAQRQGQPAALLLLDLDRFKTINDSLGHAAGDELLREVGRRLRATLRESDLLARLGGDEFVALLHECTPEDAQAVASKMLVALAQPMRLASSGPESSLNVDASIGIACSPQDGLDLDTLLKHADIAMYEAKRSGRGCARYFLSSMNAKLDERLALEADLRRALAQGQLSLHYQPKICLRQRRLIGVEALLRWHDPVRGNVPPDLFIPLAEDCGLITQLDAWVMEQACAQLARWRERGIDVPQVAVNAAALRFSREDIAGHLGGLLQRHGLVANDIKLEVTERLMLGDDARALEQIVRLNALGVHLSLDDFGTGYSSLSYLKRLQVSELKIDRSFVRDLESDRGDLALVTAIIGIGKALGIEVVAEGVETAGQCQMLSDAGCDTAQGWLFARPMPPAAIETWLNEQIVQIPALA